MSRFVVDRAHELLMREDDGAANPRLSDGELDMLAAKGHERDLEDEEVLYRPGEKPSEFFVVLDGAILIEDQQIEHQHGGPRRVLAELGRGNFLGELGLITGGLTLMTNVARGATTLLCVPLASLRDLVAADAILGETILRAFLIRRAILVGEGLGVKVVGDPAGAATRQVTEFLTRNRVPHALLELGGSDEPASLLETLAVTADHLPLVVLGERILRNPTLADVAAGLGLTGEGHGARIWDVAIVGAGPAGLAAAVYAASEGLSTVVLEAVSAGGQAAMSARIENYPGFPAGISGGELAARTLVQASKFGVAIIAPFNACGLRVEEGLIRIGGAEGVDVTARTVVIATGARYRGLDVARLDELRGLGVYFAATQVEAEACRQQTVAVVGGGNSAGQAALFLAGYARRVVLLVRRSSLEATMSSYLVERIADDSRITLMPDTQVRELHGVDQLTGLTVERSGSQPLELECSGLFVFTGAQPHTEWLAGAAGLDANGFVLTGQEAIASPDANAGTMTRAPLETTCPRVFAVGDVRGGSTKRVATAIGEGAMVISYVHQRLKEVSRS